MFPAQVGVKENQKGTPPSLAGSRPVRVCLLRLQRWVLAALPRVGSEVVEFLLQAGADKDRPDHSKATPMHYAAVCHWKSALAEELGALWLEVH